MITSLFITVEKFIINLRFAYSQPYWCDISKDYHSWAVTTIQCWGINNYCLRIFRLSLHFAFKFYCVLPGSLWSRSPVCSVGQGRQSLCNRNRRYGQSYFWFHCYAEASHIQWSKVLYQPFCRVQWVLATSPCVIHCFAYALLMNQGTYFIIHYIISRIHRL